VTAFISTGTLPPSAEVRQAVDAAYARFVVVDDGTVSDVYPALARARRESFSIVVASISGELHEAGDADSDFTLMSAAKPFVLALVCGATGVDRTRDAIGVNATGRPFNSLDAVAAGPGGRTNPMVNPGAIATTSRIPGATQDERWGALLQGLSAFAGRDLELDEEMLASARATNHRNRELAQQVHERGGLGVDDPMDAVDLYTRQSAISVTTRDLALMGATLAAGGVNPITRERVVSVRVARHVLSAMATAGMYEQSGDWLWDVGLPGKSGISGCIVTVAPGKGALATWSPPLNEAGNSVRGVLVAEELTYVMGLDVFSVPTA
jgi:glutaminase